MIRGKSIEPALAALLVALSLAGLAGCAGKSARALSPVRLEAIAHNKRGMAKLLEDRKIVLHLSEGAREWLAEAGYDPAYGARPLKRVIQKNVQDPLAEKLLAGEIEDGAVVPVSVTDDGLAFGTSEDSRPAKGKKPVVVNFPKGHLN